MLTCPSSPATASPSICSTASASTAPEKTVEEARRYYFEHTHREMRAILEGRGRAGAFTPSPGLKEFLLALKRRGIKIGLVTSGLYEKAWPEILSAFRTLELGDPLEFYDAIITAGFPHAQGRAPARWASCRPSRIPGSTPRPAASAWASRSSERNHVVGIEDSGAGVCSIRLAGFATIGIAGGNIIESGAQSLCLAYCATFEEILGVIG